MWFRRRNMGYEKRFQKNWAHEGPNIYIKKKKIWTHEGPSTKEKNDEHMKAHVLKKREKEER